MRGAVSISPPDLSPPNYEALLAALPSGVILLDLELRVLWANPYVEGLSGYSLAALTDGRRLTQLTSLAGRIYLESQFQMEMAGAGRAEELAIDLLTPSGVRMRVLINAVRTTVAGDERILVTVVNAAAKRAYEQEVPKARLAAAQAESVKADFLANISHEIRTPINGISGISGALAQTDLNVRQQEMVALIQSSSQALERLVSDILEVSRVEAGGLALEPLSIDLQSALASVIEAARLRADTKGLRFKTRLSGLDALVMADAIRLKQVLGNLLDNALKFTDEGSITVAATFDRSRERLNIRVSDTGIGFDSARVDALFEKFVQADTSITRRFGGSGLGLSIVKGLVELMGGVISASSTPGRGSRFTLSIPLALTGSAIEPPVEDAGSDTMVSRVLLVEDHPANQLVVRFILEAHGISVDAAENGRLGVELWRVGGYDLVLMDMQMPEMDGLTATRVIRAEEAGRSHTPIAMLSANAMDHHKAEALAAGADMHISKPVTPDGLLAGIAAVLQLCASRREQQPPRALGRI